MIRRSSLTLTKTMQLGPKCIQRRNKYFPSYRFLQRRIKEKTRRGLERQEGMESDSTKGGDKEDSLLKIPKQTRLLDRYLKKDRIPGRNCKALALEITTFLNM